MFGESILSVARQLDLQVEPTKAASVPSSDPIDDFSVSGIGVREVGRFDEGDPPEE